MPAIKGLISNRSLHPRMNRLAKGLNVGRGLGSAPLCHLPSPGCRQPCLCSPALVPRETQRPIPTAVPCSPSPVPVGRCRQRQAWMWILLGKAVLTLRSQAGREEEQGFGVGLEAACQHRDPSAVPGSILSMDRKRAELGAVTRPGARASYCSTWFLLQRSWSSGEIQGIFSTKCRHRLI